MWWQTSINFGTWQVETRESQVQSQAELHSESEVKLGCIHIKAISWRRGGKWGHYSTFRRWEPTLSVMEDRMLLLLVRCHNLVSPGRKEPQLKNYLDQTNYGRVCERLFWFMIDVRETSPLWAASFLCRWIWKKKLGNKQESTSKPLSSHPSWFLSQLPSVRNYYWEV